MTLLENDWTPETADQWTRHDLIASILSPLVYILATIGGAYAVFGNPLGWWLLTMAVALSLMLWAIIDRKLRVQSIAFAKHEEEHKEIVEERNRWGG
jgi:hypothetical protein